MPLKVQRDDEISINLTPMIDIVFLLIIFFMVGTRFSELESAERDIALKIPQVSGAETLTDPPRKKVINVFADGSLTCDADPVTLEELTTRLQQGKAEYSKLGVVVRGDANSLYQHVASVIATCRQADITDLNIAVKPVERR